MYCPNGRWSNSTQDEGNLCRTEDVLPSNVINRLHTLVQVPAQDEVATTGGNSVPPLQSRGAFTKVNIARTVLRSLLDYSASLDQVQITREYSNVQIHMLISLIRNKYSPVTWYSVTLYRPAIDKFSICLTCPSLAATFHAWRVLFKCCRGHVRARAPGGREEFQALQFSCFRAGRLGRGRA